VVLRRHRRRAHGSHRRCRADRADPRAPRRVRPAAERQGGEDLPRPAEAPAVMLRAIADGVNAPPDQGVSTFLFIGVVLFGAVAYMRLRDRAFSGLPRWAGWAAGCAAAACLVLAFVLPPIIRPDRSTTRPSTDAGLSF